MRNIALAVITCTMLGGGLGTTVAQDTSLQNAQPGIEAATAVTTRATVQGINYTNRTVTLKGRTGKSFQVKVGSEARNFNQIRKGDQVTFRHEESLALGLQGANQPAAAGQTQTLVRAPEGQKPAGASIRTTQLTATVENIDPKKGEVTLRLPDGKTRTLKVEEAVGLLDRLRKGDQVQATYTEAFMIDVASPQRATGRE